MTEERKIIPSFGLPHESFEGLGRVTIYLTTGAILIVKAEAVVVHRRAGTDQLTRLEIFPPDQTEGQREKVLYVNPSTVAAVMGEWR